MKRFVHSFIWAMLILISVIVLFPKIDQNALVDFGASWSAARLLRNGENPYDGELLLKIEKALGWSQAEAVIPWNPPWALAIIVPFSFLPFGYAKWTWVVFNALLLLLSADYWWTAYGGKQKYRMASWLASIWFFPCIVALYFGQSSLLVLSGVTGIMHSLRSGKVRWLMLFVLLAAIKPHLLLPMWLFFILWIFRQKRWRTLGFSIVGIVITSIGLACFRPAIYHDYFAGATSIKSPVIWATPTVGTAMRVFFSEVPTWTIFLPTVCGLLLSLYLWNRWKSKFVWEHHLDLILLLSLATASYAWIFDWAILLPAVIRILVWCQSNPRQQWSAMAGLASVLAMFVWVQSHGLFPVGAVWFPWGLMLVYVWARSRHNRLELSENNITHFESLLS